MHTHAHIPTIHTYTHIHTYIHMHTYTERERGDKNTYIAHIKCLLCLEYQSKDLAQNVFFNNRVLQTQHQNSDGSRKRQTADVLGEGAGQ